MALRANENNNTHQTNKRSATEQKIETTTTNIDTMSASDLAPFVAAVIEDGIVAEMQRKNEALKQKIEELESNIQDRDNARLLVQMTGRAGNRIYGQESLKKGRPIGGSAWWLDCDNCMCPFDEESITQLEIRVGGTVLLNQFLMGDDQFYCEESGNKKGWDFFHFQIIPFNRNTSSIHAIHAHIGLAASSSTSMDDKKTFVSLMESFTPTMMNDEMFQLEQLLHHFDILINTDDERGIGTKLTMTFETIEFHKDSISGCMSLMDKLGVQTTDEDD